MCGIVGCVGIDDTRTFLLTGLKLLEYRGYDSAGIAMVINDHTLAHAKSVGYVAALERESYSLPHSGTVGIAHTRWATHGGVNVSNAHPHFDTNRAIAVVHNGIVENHTALRTLLERDGVVFRSETDTEVIAHLIAKFYHGDLCEAVRLAVREIRGTFGIAVVSTHEPGVLIAARMGSPLVLGIGDDFHVIASDVPAILARTQQVVYLNDGEVVRATKDDYQVLSLDKTPLTPEVQSVDQQLDSIERGSFPHYMLKEIYDQPRSLENTMRGRLKPESGDVILGGPRMDIDDILAIERVIFVACGTSLHASMIAKYLFEEFLRIPSEAEHASEFRYRNPIIRRGRDLAVFTSQSGETADTLAAMREVKRKGGRTLGICNVVNSSIAREVESGIYTHAGIEIGVASTKAFTAQVTAMALLMLWMGRVRDLSSFVFTQIIEELCHIPQKIDDILIDTTDVKALAEELVPAKNMLYLGRGYNFPVALEGALKMKEISYIHAEGYPAAEMKHGPIALIDENMPVVVIAPKDRTYAKVMSNIQEIKARKGFVIAVTTEGNTELANVVDRVLYVPSVMDPLQPLLTVVPLQLLAYYVALGRGLSVDKPRNLAKAVTVE
ncbi:MAG: glutamine--fructose-6-phosphate transaminase (isomerizing) [Candidatus Sumerlaeia bacterium]|nr:glutamine--fructose-6-phosphate transaminase (isomerizing) [Candidatus Sumerlaeia bacterium]